MHYTGSQNWVHHNFTVENVSNGVPDGPASLVFAGTDKMYYIANDGYIHGYIKVNGDYNGGTWLTVSPSYACQFSASFTVKAKSDLVASPDGTTLLYIGTDGYIHGFSIVDVWTYEYFDFMKYSATNPQQSMMTQGITADSCLIYPADDRIYYIGTYSYGAVYVQGFQKSSTPGTWLTISPTIQAAASLPIDLQYTPAGGLTYDLNSTPNRLYYRATSGYLAYFEVIDTITYNYNDCAYANGALTAQQLRITGNLAIYNNGIETRIYYIGQYIGGTVPEGQYWIHCLINNGSSWSTVSPSYSALYSGQPMYGAPVGTVQQSRPSMLGQIAVSPDGLTVAYISDYLFVCFYYSSDGINYFFYSIPFSNLNDVMGDNSLQFRGFDLFYASYWDNHTVHHYKYQEDYCINPSIQELNNYNP